MKPLTGLRLRKFEDLKAKYNAIRGDTVTRNGKHITVVGVLNATPHKGLRLCVVPKNHLFTVTRVDNVMPACTKCQQRKQRATKRNWLLATCKTCGHACWINKKLCRLCTAKG